VALADAAGVAVEDRVPAGQSRAVGQAHRTDPSALEFEFGDGAAGEQDPAFGRERLTDRPGEGDHAALDRPESALFDGSDQVQGRRRRERRGAVVRGVAGEQLPQPRIGEEVAQCPPHGSREVDARQAEHAPGTDAQQHPRQPAVVVAQEGFLEAFEETRGVASESAESVGRIAARKCADGLRAAFVVGEQVEAGPVGPGVSRQQFERTQPHVVRETQARGREQFLEHGTHRQHGRSAVDLPVTDARHGNLAADLCVGLDEGDAMPGAGEREGGGEAPNARSHHHCIETLGPHRWLQL
jgi:hypothetical protein